MDALGAASVHGPEGLQAAREAGLRDAKLTGVRSRALAGPGPRMPAGEAVSSGTAGASLLARADAPLGHPLPFCIAAGGTGSSRCGAVVGCRCGCGGPRFPAG